MDDLKSCPFCNGKPRHKGAKYKCYSCCGSEIVYRYWHAYYCPFCGVSQPIRLYHSVEVAKEAWNRRDGCF